MWMYVRVVLLDMLLMVVVGVLDVMELLHVLIARQRILLCVLLVMRGICWRVDSVLGALMIVVLVVLRMMRCVRSIKGGLWS
jgi:predicted membrane-bound dolichyl-phosphate-mannose-protein mannosyltransferase